MQIDENFKIINKFQKRAEKSKRGEKRIKTSCFYTSNAIKGANMKT